MIGDLHCHTRLSDGSLGIEEVISLAKRSGLHFLSITDHDTMAGVTRASVLGNRHGIKIISGVEISAYDYLRNRKVHVLCYLPDKPDRLEGLLLRTIENRKQAGAEMAKRVMQLFPLTAEQIVKYSSSSKAIYKQHIIHTLFDMNYTDKIYGELYYQLFGDHGSCIVECEYPDVFEVVRLIRSAGGISVLAHPMTYDSFDLLLDLCEQELLDGVEVWHSRNQKDTEHKLLQVADKYRLLKTGGSDFHGMYSASIAPLATCITGSADLDALFLFKEQQRR